jgi:hypothetical protein
MTIEILELARANARSMVAERTLPAAISSIRDQLSSEWRTRLQEDMGLDLTDDNQMLGLIAGVRLASHVAEKYFSDIHQPDYTEQLDRLYHEMQTVLLCMENLIMPELDAQEGA